MNEEFRFYCPSGTYNPLAAIFFNTEGGTIKQFMNKPLLLNQHQDDYQLTGDPVQITKNMLIYFCTWYMFFVTTYGVWVPSGLFLPGILMGCSIGMLFLEFITAGLGVSILRVGG